MSGYELCHELRREFGESLVIMLVSGDRTEPEDRVAALLLGADHYLVEPFDPYELLARMRRLLARSAAADQPALTRREHQVLLLLADGRSRLEIAHDLVISPKTVATHVRHILDKLGARSRAQAVALAFRANIIPGPNGDAL
jgi:DNA-binding NarL/FixJ family response regulator